VLLEALGERGDLDVAEVAARLEGVFFDLADGELKEASAFGGAGVGGRGSGVGRRRRAGRDGFGVEFVFEGRA
jgi:hypothetical protein